MMNADMTLRPLPHGLEMRPSSQRSSGGMGLWSTQDLPAGLRMGPLDGKIVPVERCGSEITDPSFSWEVHDRLGQVLFVVDCSGSSQWMRHVKYARHDGEKNVVAIQYERNIYFKTSKEISAGTELLVWYSNSYAKTLGLPAPGQVLPDGNGVYNCEECGRSFCYPFSLILHSKYHASIPRTITPHHALLWCDECGRVFAWNFTLRAHIALKHTAHRPHQCVECGMQFTLPSILQTHMRSNHGNSEKSYKCTLCDRTFPQSSQLRRHSRTHTGGKPYKCGECGKCFADSTNLRSHTRIHTGERPFKCEYCSRRFAEGSTLKSHIRTHTGEKPFKCQHCGKAFAHLSSHRKHTLTHQRHRSESVRHYGQYSRGQQGPELLGPDAQFIQVIQPKKVPITLIT